MRGRKSPALTDKDLGRTNGERSAIDSCREDGGDCLRPADGRQSRLRCGGVARALRRIENGRRRELLVEFADGSSGRSSLHFVSPRHRSKPAAARKNR